MDDITNNAEDHNCKCVCIDVVKRILLAEKEVFKSVSIGETSTDSFSELRSLIRSSLTSNSIHEEFKKFRYEFLKRCIEKKSCCSCQQGEDSDAVESLHRSNTFPIVKSRLRHWSQSSYPERSQTHRQTVRTESIASRNRDVFSDTLSDSSSFISDGANENIKHSKHGKAVSHSPSSTIFAEDNAKELLRNELEVYQSASSCAQHPVLSNILQTPSLTSGLQSGGLLLHKNTRSVSLTLTQYIGDIFQLSPKRHRQYQKAILPNKDKLYEKLHNDLFIHLRSLEREENPYYKKTSFQTPVEYEVWKDSECKAIVELLDKNVSWDVSQDNDFVQNDHCRNYKKLVNKIIYHETGHGNQLKSDSVSSVMSDNSIPEANTVSSTETLKENFIPEKARRLLEEFSLRYRISSVTQCVLFLQCMGSNKIKDNLNLHQPAVLSEMLHQMETLLKLLENGYNHILQTEIEIMINIAGNIICEVESLMCSFLSQWKPENKEICSALALLKTCYYLLKKWNAILPLNYPECVKDWFKRAVDDDYQYQHNLGCDCVKNCAESSSSKVLRAVVHAIDSVKNGCRVGYQAIFSPYVENVAKVTAAVLYEAILEDLITYYECYGQNLEMDFEASVVLATKVVEFETCALETGFQPVSDDGYFSWRNSFHRKSSNWLKTLSETMSKKILSCIQHNECAVIQTSKRRTISQSSVGIPPIEVDNNDMVITRVNASQQKEKSSKDIVLVQDVGESSRIRLYTKLKPEEPIFTHEESTFSSKLSNPAKSDINQECASSTARHTCNHTCNATADSSADFYCAHSVVDFVVLLSRFLEFVEDVTKAIYELPEFLNENQLHRSQLNGHLQNKEDFCGKVFKVVDDLICQYLDCILNLDLCVFPRDKVRSYVSDKKVHQLKRRAKEGTVDCCRHELEKSPECNDNVETINMYRRSGVYFKMSIRINSVLLIALGMTVVWERLSQSLQINDMTSLSRTSSHSSVRSESSVSRNNRKKHYLGSGQSLSSNTTVISRGLSSTDDTEVSNKQVDVDDGANTIQDVHLDDNSSSSVDSDLEFQALPYIPVETSCYDSNNNGKHDHCEKENGSSGKESDGRKHQTLRTRRKKSNFSCMRRAHGLYRSSTHISKHSSGKKEIHGRGSSRCGSPSIRSIISDDLLQHMRDVEESTQSKSNACLRSLCGILSWRMSKIIRESITEMFGTSANLSLKLSSRSTKEDLEKSEKHCLDLVNKLETLLKFLGNWIERGALPLVHQFIWEIIIDDFKAKVDSLSPYAESSSNRAFFFLVAFREILKVFNDSHVLDISVMIQCVQPTLSVLELFVMSTTKVVDIHDAISSDPGGSTPISTKIARDITREQKSYSGRDFLERMITNMKLDKDNSDDRQKARDACQAALERRLVQLIFVKNARRNNLPELVECFNSSLESSCSSYLCKDENRDRYHSSEDLSNLSSLSTAGDRVDSINKSNFIADNNHFYAFAINLKNMPIYHFSSSDGEDLKLEFLKDILMSRRRNDATAREFLRKKNYTSRWFQLFPCIP
ncbi:uncharacterized protein LOC143450323 isoform X1 [Clavelina lepadiformis]|uniref:uncharacterized protein LOC143450323 isoform X1 n=1 Tax=Clavelina lepadiformis TaxID=159417 RepID=UPI00404252B5